MKRILVILLFVLHINNQGQAQPVKTYKLNEYLEARNKIAPLNASILVTTGIETKAEHYFGISNSKLKSPISTSTTFLIASATKPFTATAIMILLQENKLSLNDPLIKWIPEAPQSWKAITIKHLLSHTSGIQDYMILKGGAALKPGLQELLKLYQTTSPSYNHGSKYSYSNTNFVLLSYIIEKCSGIKYETYMSKNIFQPLNMTSTGFLYIKKPNGLATPYRSVFTLDTLPREELSSLEVLKGAGGMFSTTKDIALFLNGLTNIISKPFIDTMFTEAMDGYALGWHVQNQFGKLTAKHAGGINGFTSEMRYVPSDNTAIIILSNIKSNDLNIRYTAFDMMKIMNGEVPGAELTPVAYTGKYSVPDEYKARFKSSILEITYKEGFLMLTVGGSKRILIPADKGRFFFYGEPVDVEFKGNGKLLRIISPSLGVINCYKVD